MLRILFVCTGNTCRSPIAEGLCRSFLGHFRLQEEVEVASAGLYAMAGGPASREAVAIMAERGIDLSGHKTACLTGEQVRSADLILTMEEHHRRRLLEQFSEAVGKAFVLKEYVAAPADEAPATQVGTNRAGRYDIMDPFGQSKEVYLRCAMELASAVADVCIDVHRRLKRGENRD
ncbi:MAG: low molecular weight protein arginine phosphatase [Thermacetogeniaceae bacterium]